MIQAEDGIFIQIPGESEQRVLHPANIVGYQDGVYTIALEEDDITLEVEQDLLIFYERIRDFVQQTAQVEAVLDAPDESQIVGIRPIGDPVSAESRQCYRVSTLIANLSATMGQQENCQLADVSSTGFSIISSESFSIGNQVPVELRYENERFPGIGCIQSIKELGPNRYRYGLHCIETKKSGSDLTRGLQHISTAVQRIQLKRRAAG